MVVFDNAIVDHPHIWGKLFSNVEGDMCLSMKKGTSRNYKLSNPQK